jgi:hypothetical protein
MICFGFSHTCMTIVWWSGKAIHNINIFKIFAKESMFAFSLPKTRTLEKYENKDECMVED